MRNKILQCTHLTQCIRSMHKIILLRICMSINENKMRYKLIKPNCVVTASKDDIIIYEHSHEISYYLVCSFLIWDIQSFSKYEEVLTFLVVWSDDDEDDDDENRWIDSKLKRSQQEIPKLNHEANREDLSRVQYHRSRKSPVRWKDRYVSCSH